MEIIRVFIGIDLSTSLKDRIAEVIESLHAYNNLSVRWTQLSHLHITLQFIRAFAAEDSSQLIATIQHTLKNTPALTVKFHEIELFPSRNRPRSIAISLQPNAALTALSKQVGQAIVATNYAIEKRPFRGHITLGRFNERPPEDFIFENIPSVEHLAVRVNKVFLYESRPRAGGSDYVVLHGFDLGG